MSLGDIYYVVFRHKWKIILLSLAGFMAAAALYYLKPPPYESRAELLIQYVPEPTLTALIGDEQKVITPDSRGQDIINSEIQILTSLDLAEQAATNIGAGKILGRTDADASSIAAAGLIHRNLEAAPADVDSSVIVVTFKHANPEIVQPVLQEIINDYLQKHYEIHSSAGQFDDALTREQSALSVQLNATEQELADLKNKANIISLDDSRKSLADQIAKMQSNIQDAQAELAGDESSLSSANPGQAAEPGITNAPAVIPQDQLDAYNDLRDRLAALRKMEQGYQVQEFTASNALVQEVEAQFADVEAKRARLESKYPQIAVQITASASTAGSTSGSTAAPSISPVLDARTQLAQIASLQARIKSWSSQLAQLQMQATNLNNLEPTIAQLEQTRDIQKANYQNLSVSLEKSHIDEGLDTGKSPNIKWVQTPSPPGRDWGKAHKAIAMVAFGGVFAGIGWAFLIELFLDRSIKRAGQVETRLKLPLFLSIPDVSRNGHARQLKAPERQQLALENAATGNGSPPDDPADSSPNGSLEVGSPGKNPALASYFEALRDRLIVDFEIKGLTHKPKLVALTSAGRGVGVSTLAAGLAASFSTTGDGHVLLVNMNSENGAAQQFYHGKAGCNLDLALEKETRENALVQENLYVVNENSSSGNLPRVLPRRFASLLPKFKASDFDYIIFDLPPVSQTSATTRVARFMDMVLLVVESEKTDGDAVQCAKNRLVETGATVGAVLNKTRQYIPERLRQEFPGDH
jgi:succinoglycan biosynthesis transport protein ExoP